MKGSAFDRSEHLDKALRYTAVDDIISTWRIYGIYGLLGPWCGQVDHEQYVAQGASATRTARSKNRFGYFYR